ncbi:hypothetical protein [Clostridium frigidicarnis]|uniref:Uncharacterized protein n=1 Tax=Clostridium frigidicarnis TaxID=84698 RepID=A0A1I1B2N2_9CLOT|nr:hypothetical protein [Clostridium frigidicarnis]SFB44327.1 hypothetical protein SAMN04488528_10586 [Clostridium frigidicarnis]
MKNKTFKFLTCIAISFALLFSITAPALAATLSDILYRVEPKIVRINNDDSLKSYLSEAHKGSLNVSKMVKLTYYKTYSENIDITDLSMAVEILGHVYPDKIAKYLPLGLGDKILVHTSVIDIGERSIDSNRWVWDSIAAVIPSSKLLMRSAIQYDVEEQLDDIILSASLENKNLKLNKDIMRKVLMDINNGTVDPIFLNLK